MIRTRLAVVAFAVAALAPRVAGAGPILPSDAALDALAASYQLQEETFSTRENGLFLDTIINAPDVAVVTQFFGQSAQSDFQTFAGKHPFAVVAAFGEHGDEGNFAGVSSVGIAARLLFLRSNGASAADVTRARTAAIRAAQAWHVYGSIGGAGIVARGVRRATPLVAGDPAVPGGPVMLTPLKDGNGAPLPTPKAGLWRAPVAAGYDGWIWLDDTSKDQVSGYALAVAWLWDALHDDPLTPPGLLDALASDIRAFAHALMGVAPETGVDLCIRDADGRLTGAYDLNPRIVNPDGPPLPETVTLRNGTNAALALGIVRAAYHVTGDPDIGAYYYGDLVGKRDLPGDMSRTAGIIFLGAPTNYSNVNMLAIALASIGRFETDAGVRAKLAETLEHQFWSTGDTRDVSHSKQAWFDAVYGAYAPQAQPVTARIRENLLGFKNPPAFERDRINCDPQEIAAGSCLAIDGTTVIKLAKQLGHGGSIEAEDVVPMSLRPDSDFEWRSDPHDVNGMGSTLIDPGGDFLAALWLARSSDMDSTKNGSPFARPALPYGDGDAGVDGGNGAGAAPVTPAGGCGCRAIAANASPWAAIAAAAVILGLGRRRARSRGSDANETRSDRIGS